APARQARLAVHRPWRSARGLPRTLPSVSAACACLQLPFLPPMHRSERLPCSSLRPTEGRSPARISEISAHSIHTAASSPILLTEYFRPSNGLHRPFSQVYLSAVEEEQFSFNPERAPQAI